MAIGLIFMVTGFFVAVVFVPETLPPPSSSRLPSGGAQTLLDARARGAKKGLHDRVREHLQAFIWLCRWMAKNAGIVLLLSCFLLFHLGEQADALLMLQYVAKRLGWTIGKVSGPWCGLSDQNK